MMAHNPFIHDMEQFLIYVHMASSNYIPSYFGCILIGYTIQIGVWNKFRQDVNHALWISLIAVPHLMAAFSPVLTHTWNILPPEFNPLYILTCRLLIMIQSAFLLIYFYICDPIEDQHRPHRSPSKLEETKAESYPIIELKENESYSISKGFIRCCFSIYMSNYLYIRTDFFTERNLFYSSIYALFKRIVSSFVFIAIVSILFQLIFIAPFSNLINQWKSPHKGDNSKKKLN